MWYLSGDGAKFFPSANKIKRGFDIRLIIRDSEAQIDS